MPKPISQNDPVYYTFKRSCTNWGTYAYSRKITVETGLTFSQAKQACEKFNGIRDARQKRKGTMMEFTRE
jgi:outer membrane receptor for monomeric catechols